MYKDLYANIKSDLYRLNGFISLKVFLKSIFFNAGFIFLFWLRCTLFFRNRKIERLIFYPFSWIFHRHFMFKFGIGIPYSTKIGTGLKINHFSGIIINSKAIIGNNVTISHGVTIGNSDRGKNAGCPEIGNEVYIGPGAKLFGNIKVGDNVAIGANSVVLSDIPPNSVVAGVPAKLISINGSKGYVKNIYKQLN